MDMSNVPARKPVANSNNAWVQPGASVYEEVANDALSKPHDGFQAHREHVMNERKNKNSWAQDAAVSDEPGRAEDNMGLAIDMAKSPNALMKKDSKKSSKPVILARMMSTKSMKAIFGSTENNSQDTTPPLPPLPLDKASRVLGLSSLQSSPSRIVPQASHRRQAASDPAVAGNLGNEAGEDLFRSSVGYSRPPPEGFLKPNGMVFGNGNMSPTKLGSYGTIGRMALSDNHFARVTSHRGVIESTEEEAETEKDRKIGTSNVYSPSVYEGVWENNPMVGHSLQPFSSQHQLAKQYEDLIGHHNSVVSTMSQNSNTVSLGAPLQNPIPLSPTLVLGERSSLALSSARASKVHESAEVLPLFAEQNSGPATLTRDETLPTAEPGDNSVPAPPSTYPGYKQSGLSEFANLARTLHHHIDVSSDRMFRMMTAKMDKIHDEVIRRTESLEERIAKMDKGVSRQYLSALNHEFENLAHDLQVSATSGTENKKLLHAMFGELKAMTQRMADMEGAVNATANQCDHFGPQVNNRNGRNITQQQYPMFYDGTRQFTVPATNGQGQRSQEQPQGQSVLPRTREFSEDYYQSFPYPLTMTANVPETDNHERSSPAVYDTAPAFGIRGPDGIVYEVPSFMHVTNEGLVIRDDQSPPPTPFQQPTLPSGGNTLIGPVPVGVRGPENTAFEQPSFASIDAAGNMTLDNFNSDGVDVPPMAAFMSINPEGNVEIEGPEGVTYELESFDPYRRVT
ncbi:hypothetical protein MMC13_006801 [Lambiella insularis]|nr:hypothetical protein [Lambiella insularis]